MKVITLYIKDFSRGQDIYDMLKIMDVAYIPALGEHISLSGAQEKLFEDRVYHSSYLKKAHMKYVMRRGRKPLKRMDWKDLTPDQIRKKIDKQEWYIFLPPTLKVVEKNITIYKKGAHASLTVEFSDKFYQTL